MNAAAIVRYALSFLGGGLAVAVGNWFFSVRAARNRASVEYLREQLSKLYGPLYFFTSQNEQFFRLYDDIHNAYSAFFNRSWSQEQRTQAALEAGASATIDLGNTYVQRVVQNNERVMGILEAGWHLVDPEHVEMFSRFQVDMTRFKVEVGTALADKKVPHAITQSLGSISYMRPELIDRVREAVAAKRKKLSGLGS